MEGGSNKKTIDFIFEKIPPIIAFVLILFPIVGSFINVQAVIVFLILIYIYFLYKSASTSVQFALALRRMYKASKINWKEMVEGLKDIPNEIEKLKNSKSKIKQLSYSKYESTRRKMFKKYGQKSKSKRIPGIIKRVLFFFEKRRTLSFINEELSLLNAISTENIPSPDEIQHVIIVPHVKEPVSILRETLMHLKRQTFNTKQINVVLAAEAADPNGVAVSEGLKEEFKEVFNNIWITNHTLVEGEIVGKSANMNWAGRQVHKEIKKLGWDLKKTTVTSCDADSKLDKNYFAYQTYKFLTSEKAEYKFYTTAMIFYNNIWRLPFYARVKNSFHSIFNAANLVRSDKLVPFSTYTTSFWLIEQIGFWDPWITPEDYHLFFKSLFKFDRHVGTIPMFMQTLSDAAEGEGHKETILNNYKQSRRWAWGISDGGWMMKNLVQNFFKFSLRAKYITTHVLFDHIMGLSIAFLVLLGGAIPSLINPDFNNQTTGVLFPIITEQLVRFTLVFMITVVLLDFYINPTPKDQPWWKNIQRVLEWVTQPFASFFLTAIPNFEAQTRLVFGQYLEYYVTKKKGVGKKSDKKEQS